MLVFNVSVESRVREVRFGATTSVVAFRLIFLGTTTALLEKTMVVTQFLEVLEVLFECVVLLVNQVLSVF